VFTSPPDTVASANLAVGCMPRMVSATFLSLPAGSPRTQTLRFTLDAASVDKNWLVPCIVALCVHHRIAEVCELAFLLQDHAHQIVDRFGWQHTRRVRGKGRQQARKNAFPLNEG